LRPENGTVISRREIHNRLKTSGIATSSNLSAEPTEATPINFPFLANRRFTRGKR